MFNIALSWQTNIHKAEQDDGMQLMLSFGCFWETFVILQGWNNLWNLIKLTRVRKAPLFFQIGVRGIGILDFFHLFWNVFQFGGIGIPPPPHHHHHLPTSCVGLRHWLNLKKTSHNFPEFYCFWAVLKMFLYVTSFCLKPMFQTLNIHLPLISRPTNILENGIRKIRVKFDPCWCNEIVAFIIATCTIYANFIVYSTAWSTNVLNTYRSPRTKE